MNLWQALRLYWRMLMADEKPTRDEDYPPEARWWAAPARPTTPHEREDRCPHCEEPLGDGPVRQCPGCATLFHAACYEATEGGQAYATPGCDACRHRTYWR